MSITMNGEDVWFTAVCCFGIVGLTVYLTSALIMDHLDTFNRRKHGFDKPDEDEG